MTKSEPELLNMDALDYEFPASPLLLYAYNPFRRSEVQRLVGRIAETYEKSPRYIVVAYHTLAHGRVFKRHPLFKEMKLGGSPRGIRLFSTPIAAPG